jgi:tRNA(Ile2)-agmatinylcytidine synthase
MITELELESIATMVEGFIHDYVEKDYPNTNPGVVFLKGSASEQVQSLAKLALWRVVPISLALRIIEKQEIIHFMKGNGRGLVGALSAVGNTLDQDHTYEYIAYRSLEDCTGKRGVDPDSVRSMDKMMGDRVFSNIDTTTNRIMIEPHGRDPVLYGIRGESPNDVIKAAKHVRSTQTVERWMVFRSNQGTGEHLKHLVEIKDLRPYMTAIVSGEVETKPIMIEGGHTIFRIKSEDEMIDCAAYEPSGEFRDTVMKLAIGDSINVHAGVRPASQKHGLTLNLEGLEVVRLAELLKVSNPVCPKCGKRMKSAGARQGYKCVKCGHKDKEMDKIKTPLMRDLHPGLYLPPQRAQRHLTRPNARVGKMNSGPPASLIAKWHSL